MEQRCLLSVNAAALPLPQPLHCFCKMRITWKQSHGWAPYAVPLILYLMYFSSKCHETHRSSKVGPRQINVSGGGGSCDPSVPSACLVDLLLGLYSSNQYFSHQTCFIFYPSYERAPSVWENTSSFTLLCFPFFLLDSSVVIILIWCWGQRACELCWWGVVLTFESK